MAGCENGSANDLEVHGFMEAIQGGAPGESNQMVQLLGGSPQDPFGDQGQLKGFKLGAAWRRTMSARP